MTSQNLSFFFNHFYKQWLTERKKGKREIEQLEDFKKEKSFLDEINLIFHIFEGLSLRENKNSEHKSFKK